MLFSEDMLIRSMRENQKNVIPFISLMKPFIATYELYELGLINSFQLYNPYAPTGGGKFQQRGPK